MLSHTAARPSTGAHPPGGWGPLADARCVLDGDGDRARRPGLPAGAGCAALPAAAPGWPAACTSRLGPVLLDLCRERCKGPGSRAPNAAGPDHLRPAPPRADWHTASPRGTQRLRLVQASGGQGGAQDRPGSSTGCRSPPWPPCASAGPVREAPLGSLGGLAGRAGSGPSGGHVPRCTPCPLAARGLCGGTRYVRLCCPC